MQKKTHSISLLFTLMLTLALSLSAQAAQISPRWNSTIQCTTPSLYFSGTTATCSASLRAVGDAKVDGTLTLYLGTTEVDSWPVSGTDRVNVSGSCTVTKGKTYKLVLDVTVSGPSGTDHIVKNTTATCT